MPTNNNPNPADLPTAKARYIHPQTYVWFVKGDPDNLILANKPCAETLARLLFPDEDVHTRYARIYYKPVLNLHNL